MGRFMGISRAFHGLHAGPPPPKITAFFHFCRSLNMNVTLYHNPRCSTSCKALALLQERGLKPRVVEYLKHPT